MSDISLSKAVRSNLLSLQNTANLMSKTQNRLATGLKVNSALDNPTNFFTASSLNSRASDINQLLDGMANGIQTLEAADNGLKAITKTLESMQSTLRQARQDKSFQTGSFGVALPSSLTGDEVLSFTGGAVGSGSVTLTKANESGDGGEAPAPTTGASVTGTTPFGATAATITAGGDMHAGGVDASGGAISFDISVDGGDAVTVTLATTGGDGSGLYSADDIAEAINTELGLDDQTATVSVALDAAGNLSITSDAPGGDSNITVTDGASGSAAALGFTDGQNDDGAAAGVDASGGAITFDIAVDGGDAVTVTLETTGGAGGDGFYSADDIAGAINTALSGEGQTSEVSVSFDATTGGLVITSDSTEESSSVVVSNGDSGDVTPLGFTDGQESDPIVPGEDDGEPGLRAKTVDELVSEINENFAGQLRASNDKGTLRIENLSTQKLSIGGVNAETGRIDGSEGAANSATVDGNSMRADLTRQYNELRDQLDKLADDASFNGINLLRGDNLKITFNEIGTSEIDIQSKEGKAINADNLQIRTNMDEADFDSDDDIDDFLTSIKSAINEVRSQASAFGSSLSIVQNRQDFSKNMINTLQTGAANLTLADTNEEAANLLALQTRQQLSSTALSMASQADQAVLRLF